jgi:hypothetical protein
MKYFLSLLLVIFLLSGVFWVGSVVDAQSIVKDCTCKTGPDPCKGVDKNTSNPCEKYCCGYYQVNDVMDTVIDASNILFGFIGSLVLLFFIYGGFLFLTAAGRREQVAKGQRVLVGSVIGILIVFFSYTIVGFVFSELEVNNASKFYSSTWFR